MLSHEVLYAYQTFKEKVCTGKEVDLPIGGAGEGQGKPALVAFSTQT